MSQRYDAAIIGGGFYGCAIAVFLAKYLGRIVVIEREQQLLQRASYVNQARLHTGYHYPRSFRTAASSLQNRSAFEEIYQESVDSSFKAIYALARSGSKVSRGYFERFCRQLGLPVLPASRSLVRQFVPRLVDGIFECEESAFRASALRRILGHHMMAAGVEVRAGASVTDLRGGGRDGTLVALADAEPLAAGWVFNCTYSSLNRIVGQDRAHAPKLKHQLTEVCLVEVPEPLRQVGVTIIDGPFFSIMPFPDRGLHSMTHVRYTPHFTWSEAECPDRDPDRVLSRHAKMSRFGWMHRDAQRYLPILADMRLVDTLFEIKTLLLGTDVDDARPIVFHRHQSNPRVVSILGGKIDNIFDVLEVIRRELDLGP